MAGRNSTAAAVVISVPHPTEKQLKQTLKNTKYSHPGPTARHILSSMESFSDLKPTIKEYNFPNGKRTDLMQLSGTIPVTIVDQEYNIPVRVWLQRGYPKEKPFVYINPTSDMAIASVGYIDTNGKVSVSYLSEWKEGRSDLTTLIQVVRFKFSQQCPVYTVRKTPIIPKSGSILPKSGSILPKSGSILPKSGSFTLPRVMSTSHAYAPQTPGGLMFSPKKDETEERASCGHEPELEKLRKEVDEGKVELEKMRKEVDESRVEINMLKSSLEAAKRELAQEMAHVEELKQSKELDQRGSFTSSLIDAMQQDMQQQIANEKEMKEKYKHRLDAMITEMTQVREDIGILRVDKEDYQQRLRTTATELQHMKKKMHELRNELSTVQGRFEAAETNLAKEQAESESLRRKLKQVEDDYTQRRTAQLSTTSLESSEAEKHAVKEAKELQQRLKEAEEKLILATNKAMELEKEKDELFTSFMAQISQTSLLEQQMFEEKEQLQLQLHGTLQQLNDSFLGQQEGFVYDPAPDLEEQLEMNQEKAIVVEHSDRGQCQQNELMEEESVEESLGSSQHSAEVNADVEGQVMIPETVFKELQEERDMLKQELEKALRNYKVENTQQSPSEEERRLTEKIHELTTKLREKEATLPSVEAYSGVVAENYDLKERLEEVLSKIVMQEEAEEQMREEIRTLQERLSTTQEVAENLKSKLKNELEKSKMTSQLEAELMEKTCVMSQLTADKVTLQFKVLELQQTLQGIQEKSGKANSQLDIDLMEKSRTVSQLTTEKEELLRKVQDLQKHIQETQQQNEPQISDKDVVSYEEIKLTQNMLGTGAWGYVVMGRFRGKVVAVKCLHKDILSRFSKIQVQREISIMAEVRHPNLVLFIAAVLDAPTGPMIITELLSYTLRRAYQEEIVTSSLEKLSIMQEVGLALNYLHLHQKPIIHRDISSTNVLLEELANNQWRAKLSDFGSANLVRLASTPGEGALVYSAPEMRTEAHKPQAPSADVYSYGVLLCEVITSSFPDHSSLGGMLETARIDSQSVARIIEMCLSEDPSNRPTMGVVITRLEELINMALHN